MAMPRIAIGSLLACLAFGSVLAAEGQDRPRRPSAPDRAPKAGDEAPDWTLKKLDEPETEVTLSDFKARRPVVLVFGSYT